MFTGRANNAVSAVATVGGINNSSNPVTFSVTTGEGTKFPATTTKSFKISIDNEILLCTSRTGDSLTCSRAQEGTTIASHAQGAVVELRITSGKIGELEEIFEAASTTSNAENVTLDKQASAPTTPAAGYLKIYAKDDDKVYKLNSAGAETELGAGAGGASFWADVPGTPTRVSDTQFTITDTGNAGSYDKLFAKGTILKWLESTTVQLAIVTSATYGTNTVTVNIVGNSLTAGFTAMKYCIQPAMRLPFIITPFPSAAVTNVSLTHILKEAAYIISADLDLTGAGAGAGSTIVDINDDGTTMFTTKPTITTTGTSDPDNASDNCTANTLTASAAGSLITVDVDSVTATAPTGDGLVTVFAMPVGWLYR